MAQVLQLGLQRPAAPLQLRLVHGGCGREGGAAGDAEAAAHGVLPLAVGQRVSQQQVCVA
eukprot:CAMPEP_0202918430 /NCGR_PEP_ID=MMETSP1392-20130828/73421_1 /ASSEMBLY_ACC=CAM_ASM_000868 /TAXON_ID=225041 /ORGANISM="Chlamydomonas chlamydogama, Strain SAG 11-48b" /LENGTH=59 /DNA_ID=CAMNT_0049611483 /DNA_START=6 /DNA_END=182 /DNA_ORIENTATION=-